MQQRQMQRRRLIRFTRFFALTLLFIFSFACFFNPLLNLRETMVSAQTVRSFAANEVVLGTNLMDIADWSTEMPFVDGFKSARLWFTQCTAGQVGCQGNWTTEEERLLNLDQYGWVKSLPRPEDAPEYTKVGTLLYRDLDGKYPGGKYVVLYKGEGKIEYGFDAKKDEAASRTGRDVIDVTPSDGGIYLSITQTDPRKRNNYIRDIRVVPIQSESTYQQQIFNPAFLEQLKHYRALRFMNWMQTNDSTQSAWSDRPVIQDATYARRGVPLEIMLELANRLKMVPWFNMPHKATDDYMTRFAQLVKRTLNPQLKVYVEFSNEVWNWQFAQAHYALEQGKKRWGEDKGDAFAQWTGMRSAQMSNIWKRQFGTSRNRVVSVIPTQTGWRGLEKSILDCPLWVAEGNKPCYQNGIDVYAITGYFSGNMITQSNLPIVESWLKERDGGWEKSMTQLSEGGILAADPGFDDTVKGLNEVFRYHKQIARDRNLNLVAYEGGQHLTSPSSADLTSHFIAMNRRAEMKDLYRRMLAAWEAEGGALFMHFLDVSRPSQWGSWGALEYTGQTRSPKYDALVEFAQAH
jgi:hypothetical protein